MKKPKARLWLSKLVSMLDAGRQLYTADILIHPRAFSFVTSFLTHNRASSFLPIKAGSKPVS
jgi:hypothetical protein